MNQMPMLNNQENNKFLLNLIKDKFAKQGSKDNMPCTITSANKLKANGNTTQMPSVKELNRINVKGDDNCDSRKQLNEFLLQQLKAKQVNGELCVGNCNGIQLPELQAGCWKTEKSIEKSQLNIPLLQEDKSPMNISSSVGSLNSAFSRLTCAKQQCSRTPSPIDLTKALANSSKQLLNAKAPSTSVRTLKGEMDFEIPFIECDRTNSNTSWLKKRANEYCTIDLTSNTVERPHFKQPSGMGRILTTRYKPYEPMCGHAILTTTKYHLIPFQFNTKSPDDIVLSNFNKIL